jgi:hypothetical protein
MRGLFFFLLGCLHAKVAAAELIALRYVEDADDHYQRTKLALEKVATNITCSERLAKIDCQLEAHYTIANYTEETETILVAFVSADSSSKPSLLDKQSNILRTLTEEEQEAFYVNSFNLINQGASLQLAPGQQKELIVQETIKPDPASFNTSQRVSSLISRHVFSANNWNDEFGFEMLCGLLIEWWPVIGEVSLIVKVPANWVIVYDPKMPNFESNDEPKTQTLIFGSQGIPKENFTLSFYAKTPPVQGGGVLFGVGGALGTERSFLFRLGYEAGNTKGMLTSLSAETNFHSQLKLVPLLGVGTPWSPKFPSLGFLFGVPLQVEQGQSISAGFRVQLDATYGPIGISMPFDTFPSQEPHLQTALLAHFSF